MSSTPTTTSRPWSPGLSWPKTALAALPMLLLTALMLLGGRPLPHDPLRLVPLLAVFVLSNVLFVLMLRTGKTDRFRAILFVTVAVCFVLSFIPNLLEVRGNIGLTGDDLVQGKTPFCHMVIPMTVIPAALTRTIIFPGSMLTGFAAIGSMLVLWLAATLALGRGFCSWGCFFGGLEDGLSRVRNRPLVKAIGKRWTYLPYAVLGTVVVISALTLTPTYCEWLCPFKSVTEFNALTNTRAVAQAVIFFSLFAGLVVVGPVVTRKRTQCGLFCPMGAFQGFTNKLNAFEVRVDRERCSDCGQCEKVCPTFSLDRESLAKGGTRVSCVKCGKCVDACPKGAAAFHIKGTALRPQARSARLLFLYPAFLFLTVFGSGMIQDGLYRVLLLVTTGSMIAH
ncbi:MAG: 4Fe-4S dicluster domain-containing protein [Thermoanaerobaculaceae bacterium]|nr:4Fe-4S dicluster domain-containing protein [Thermoanaerobaculaceae bacterium]